MRSSGFAGIWLRCCWCSPDAARGVAQGGSNDAQIQADVTKALDNKRFKDVKARVQNGVVTLTGTVDVYSDKEDADNKAHHRKNVKGVENLIEVGGADGRGCDAAQQAGGEAGL